MKLTRFLSLALGLTFGAATAAETLNTGSYWTQGVSEAGGWYDINKAPNADPEVIEADDNMCYAAAACNIITWWQNSPAGSTLTSNAPKGLENIWQELVSCNQSWEDGGDPLPVVNWWVSGVYFPTDENGTADWERFYLASEDMEDSEGYPVTLHKENFTGYYFDQYGLDQKKLSGFLMDMQMYSRNVTEIDFADLLNRGCAITLAIASDTADDGHSNTLWGVEYDEEGTLTTMWITDSDDEFEGLIKVAVTVDKETHKIWLGEGYFAEDFYVDGVTVINARESFKWSPISAEAYVSFKINPETHNGRAGVALLTDVFMNEEFAPEKQEEEEEEEEEENEPAAVAEAEMPTEEETEEDTALESISDAMDYGKMNDRDAAAVAGASTAVLGQAFAGDMDRQLNAIRNRAAMGNCSQDAVVLDNKSGSLKQPGKFFAWVNAEGNRAEQNNDGSAAGYTLSSWGGTLGAGMQVNNKLTLGLALTAMHGDLKSDGPDSLDADMGLGYLSAFARYQGGSWSHSFICSHGALKTDYKRYALGNTHKGDTEGESVGLMYELSRSMQLGSHSLLSPVFNIAYRHTEVDAYNESGSDAALSVGKQELDTVTVGLGARYAATVGQQTLNRACAFDARALVKYDLGDTQSDTSVGFMGYATRANIESAERGALGLELGAGIAVPVGPGCIFTDGAVELRSDYTNFNATAGYKIQF